MIGKSVESAARPASIRLRRRPTLLGLLAAVSIAVGVLPAAASASPYLAGDQIRVNHYAQIESEKLGGLTLPGGAEKFITVHESSLQSLPEHGPDGTVFQGAADTDCVDAHGGQVGPAVHCTITVAVSPHVSNSHGEPTKNLAVISSTLDADLGHEVFHCYQAVMAGTLANLNRPEDDWLVEGSATWVESDLVPSDTSARDEWAVYLASPKIPLFKRTYTAIGFFAHLESSGISPWSRFRAMFAAASNAAAYNVSVSLSEQFLDSEASSFFRDPSLGPEWDTRGLNVPTPDEVNFKPTKLKLTTSAAVPLSVEPYADGAYDLSIAKLPSSTPALEVDSTGYVWLHSTHGGVVNVREPSGLMLCSDPKGCDCPSQPHPEYKDFEQGDLAITGGPAGGHVVLTPRKRCEELLPARSCEGLLPGFTRPIGETLERLVGKPTVAESSERGGFHSAVCAFLSEGQVSTNAEGEEFLDGAIVPGLTVSRAATIPDATKGFEITRSAVTGAETVPGVGSEAWIAPLPPESSDGEILEGATAAVRERNVYVAFSIVGIPEDASRTAVLTLLSRVAAEL